VQVWYEDVPAHFMCPEVHAVVGSAELDVDVDVDADADVDVVCCDFE
jgi:hypothetical protein